MVYSSSQPVIPVYQLRRDSGYYGLLPPQGLNDVDLGDSQGGQKAGADPHGKSRSHGNGGIPRAELVGSFKHGGGGRFG